MPINLYIIKFRDGEKVVYDAEVRRSGGSNYILVPRKTGLKNGTIVEVTLRILKGVKKS